MHLPRRQLLASSLALSLTSLATHASAQARPPLRVAWLQGNPVQARVSPAGKPQGPAIDMAEAIGKKLGRPVQITAVAGTGPLAESVRSGAADIAFIAFDPSRAKGLSFTQPYLLSLNGYAVLPNSRITKGDEVDSADVRVGAILTDTGGLYLQRTLTKAKLVGVASVEAGVEQLKAGAIDVLASSSQRLNDVNKGAYRILPGHFFEVPQCIAVREDQPELLAAAAAAVAEARASGALAASIKRWNLAGAAAPTPLPLISRAEAAKSLAPSGRLRVAINLGNNVLAQRSPAGELTGVSVVLAKALAERLQVPLEMIPFDAAGKVFAALEAGGWDLAFLAIEPERAAVIDFSPPYVAIEATYLVRSDAPFRTVGEVDRPGARVAVAKGAAYDLFLSRNLKHAELKRAPTGLEAVAMFKAEGLDAVAGIRQFLDERAAEAPGLRVMQDRFSAVSQAVGVPKGRTAGATYVRTFLEEMKASGAVRKALDATGQSSALVAPPA